MKALVTLILIITTTLISFGQEKVPFWEKYWHDQANKDSTEISAWEKLNLETAKWNEVKHIFIPSDLKNDTLLIENLTLKQHRADFKRAQKVYYDSAHVDTMRARFRPEIPDFIANQESESNYIIKNYNGPAKTVMVSNLSKQPINGNRYVLKKILKINHLNPRTGHGDAFIEYYFYDRKEKKEYPHMSATIDWLVEHMNN